MLKAFQLRAARITTNISLRAVGELIGLTKAAVSLWEHQDSFSQIKTSNKNIIIIKQFFNNHGISFPDEHSINLKTILKGKKLEGLTRFQLRAARAMLHITQEELATLIEIPRYIIQKAEYSANNRYLRMYSPMDALPIKLKHFFEGKNICFEHDFQVSFLKCKKILDIRL
ncbi:MAG: hypothetical protein EOP33_05330 [Rickettsiaceae bacterium]|nr:MAG: hypothetical protein EOP33_05330 [Rickettsiaceae bacterium]